MQAATVEPLDIEIHRILKSHGGERQALMPQTVEEGVKIHLVGEGTGRNRLLRGPAPMAGDIFPVVPLTAA